MRPPHDTEQKNYRAVCPHTFLLLRSFPHIMLWWFHYLLSTICLQNIGGIKYTYHNNATFITVNFAWRRYDVPVHCQLGKCQLWDSGFLSWMPSTNRGHKYHWQFGSPTAVPNVQTSGPWPIRQKRIGISYISPYACKFYVKSPYYMIACLLGIKQRTSEQSLIIAFLATCILPESQRGSL